MRKHSVTLLLIFYSANEGVSFGHLHRWISHGDGGDGLHDDDVHDGDVHDGDVHDDDDCCGDYHDENGLADCNDNCCAEPELNKQSKPKKPVHKQG